MLAAEICKLKLKVKYTKGLCRIIKKNKFIFKIKIFLYDKDCAKSTDTYLITTSVADGAITIKGGTSCQ